MQGSPEVQGSKFVIGAIIPGSNKATKEDAFVVVRPTALLSATLEEPVWTLSHVQAHAHDVEPP